MAHHAGPPSVTSSRAVCELLRGGPCMSYPCIGEGGREVPAAALVEEARAINEATGNKAMIQTSLVVAVWSGRPARAHELISAGILDATAESVGPVTALAEYARAVLYNGLGQYEAAAAAALRSCEDDNLGVFTWSLTELVEAGVRIGRPDVAVAALRRLEQRTPACGTDWALGIQARSRALLSAPQAADAFFREALERLAASRIALHLARAQLLYG